MTKMKTEQTIRRSSVSPFVSQYMQDIMSSFVSPSDHFPSHANAIYQDGASSQYAGL